MKESNIDLTKSVRNFSNVRLLQIFILIARCIIFIVGLFHLITTPGLFSDGKMDLHVVWFHPVRHEFPIVLFDSTHNINWAVLPTFNVCHTHSLWFNTGMENDMMLHALSSLVMWVLHTYNSHSHYNLCLREWFNADWLYYHLIFIRYKHRRRNKTQRPDNQASRLIPYQLGSIIIRIQSYAVMMVIGKRVTQC